MPDLGTTSVGLGLEMGGFASGLASAKDMLTNFSAATVAGASVAVAGLGIAAIKMAGDYEQSTKTLVTGAGESAANLAKVSSGMLQLSRDTGTTTADLTAGMFQIESAGYHGAAGLEVLKAAAQGAKVGNADLASVANGVTTAMVDYASSNLTAAQATNILLTTVASGKTNMQALSTSMSVILPTASAAKVSLTDVAGAMATMTGAGVDAANAATYLKQMFIALQAPNTAAINTLKSIGLTSQNVSTMMQKSLPDTLQLITDKLGKKFPEGSAAYMAAIKDISGGAQNMQAMLNLTGSHMQTFIGNTKNIAETAKTAGNSISGWSTVQGEFNFKIDQAKAMVTTLGIQLGTSLIPVVLSGAAAFAKDMQPAITMVAAVIMSQLVPAAMGLWKQLGPVLIPAVQLLGSVLKNDAGPALSGVVSVVALVLTGLTNLIMWVKHTGDGFSALGTNVQAAISQVDAAVQTSIGVVQTGVTAIYQWRGAIETVATILAVVFGPTLIKMGVQATISGGQIAASFVAQIVRAGVSAAAQGAVMTATFVKSMIESGIQAVRTGAMLTASLIPAIISTSVQFARTAAAGVASATTALIAFAAEGWTSAAALLTGLIPAVIAAGADFIAMAAGGITAAIAGMIGYATAAWAAAAATIAATWPILLIIVAVAALVAIIILVVTHWQQVSSFLHNVAVVAFHAIENAIHNVVNALQMVIGKVQDFMNLLGNLKNVAGNVLGGIGNSLHNAHIPGFAMGTMNAPGGLAMVGEHGPELVDLPQGSRVYPTGTGPANTGNGGGGNQYHVHVTNQAPTMSEIAIAFRRMEVLYG